MTEIFLHQWNSLHFLLCILLSENGNMPCVCSCDIPTDLIQIKLTFSVVLFNY